MEICYIRMLIYTVCTVCFGILIVCLNTAFIHFFMYEVRFHNMFGHGNPLVKMCMNPTHYCLSDEGNFYFYYRA